jgi:hypothetical protein
MSRVKEFYFDEINKINEKDDFDYQYELWISEQKNEDENILNFIEKNKEQIEGEKIFNLTNTYPF